jgi:hypothetical protein
VKAYKYFDSALRTKILEEGSFRIGTLYDYRKTEAHGAEIGDSREGKIGAHSHVLSWSSSNPRITNEHASSFVRGNAVVFGEGSSISFGPGGAIEFGANGVALRNVGLRSELQVLDLYVFSFSLAASNDLMRRMGYGACFEISDIDEFLRQLPPPNGARLAGWAAVSYQPREMHFEAAKRTNPALIKEPVFSYQQEFRAIWEPSTRPIQAAFVQAPDVAKGLCHEVTPSSVASTPTNPQYSLCDPKR